MARVDIPRLDVLARGIDPAVMRTALDRLPTELAAALRRPAPPAGRDQSTTVRVTSRVDAQTLASALAERIAAVVRQRTQTPSHVPVTSSPRLGAGD